MMETLNTVPPDIEAEELPDTIVPSDIGPVFQAGQFLLMLLATCYFAGEIILPIVLAFVLNLVLQPLMRLLEKLRLPRSLAALAIILVLGGSIIGLGAALSGPAVSWAQKLPKGLPRLQERLSFLGKPIHTLEKFLHQAEGLTQETGPAVSTVVVQGSGWSEKLLSGTRAIASGLFTTVLVLFFLLIAGDIFLRQALGLLKKFLECVDRFAQKIQALLQSRQAFRQFLSPRKCGSRERRSEPDDAAAQHQDNGKRGETEREAQLFEQAHQRLQNQVQHKGEDDRENDLSGEVACRKQHQKKLARLKNRPDIRWDYRVG